jgi:hypothetical protein
MVSVIKTWKSIRLQIDFQAFLSKNESVLRASHGGLFSKTKGIEEQLCKKG